MIMLITIKIIIIVVIIIKDDLKGYTFKLRVVPCFPPGDRRESSVEKAKMADERARENWGENKIKREGGGKKERMGEKRGDYRQPIVQKSARPLMASFGFSVNRSLHVGISIFSIVMTACSFENVLKLKPQQESACAIKTIFRRKS